MIYHLKELSLAIFIELCDPGAFEKLGQGCQNLTIHYDSPNGVSDSVQIIVFHKVR